jgi:PAS domain S-box-containing protein
MDKDYPNQNAKRRQDKNSKLPLPSTTEIKDKSERRYRLLFNSVKEGILLLDYETEKIIDANQSITELTGFPIEEIPGKEVWDLELFEDRDLYESTIKEIKSNGQTYVKNIPGPKQNGENTILELISHIYKEGNKKIIQCNISGFEAGINSKSKSSGIRHNKNSKAVLQSEAKTKTIMDGISTGILIVNPRTKIIVDINTEAARLFGEKKEKIIGHECHKFICPAEKGRCPVIDLGQNVDKNERILINGKGEKIPVIKTVTQINIDGENLLLENFIDISFRKNIEENLRSEKERYKAITNAIPDLVFRLDSEGRYLDYKADEKELAVQTGDIIGKTNQELMPPDFADLVEEKIKEALKTGETQYFEFQLPVPGKGMRIYNARMVASGKNEVITFVRDITERKASEEILRKSEAKLEEAAKIARLATWEFDVESKKFKFNDQFYDLLGTSAEKEGGYYLSSNDYVNKFLYPEDAKLLISEAQKAKKSTNPDYSAHIDHRIKYPNGQVGYVAVNLRIEKGPSGRTTRIYGVYQDITERKKNEESLRLFRKLIDNSNDAIEVIDIKTGQYLDVNKKACSDLGYTREELLNMKVFDVDPNHNNETFKSMSKKFNPSGSMLLETQHKRKDGSIFPVEVNITLVELEKSYIISVVRDITERKHYEHELIKAKEKAEESDSLKSAFLANMSHEIRTPMNGILGFTELLKEPMLSGEEQKKYVDIIEKSGMRMLSIINDIISISKIEAGQIEVSIAETNINDQLEYIYLFFKKEANLKNVDLSVGDFLPKDEAIIKTDREKVYAVLINLVKNAIKFTKEGSITFGCGKKGEFLEFYVKDTGTGVPEEKREIIFDRFRQGSEDMNRDYEGAGLGLAICKGYLEMIGGKIWMYPNMYKDPESGISHEKGSAFYFTIPLQLNDTQLLSQGSTEDLEKFQTQNKNLKVLIAEDDEVSQIYINKIAKDFSKKVLNASNGVEAVEICKNNPDLDLILMDLKMPVMGGLEAVRKIREFNKDIIIIAQTAYGMTGDKENSIEAGCNDYISKPLNRNELIELVNNYFE